MYFPCSRSCQRLSSITTRIKTPSWLSQLCTNISCQRLSSITTRIKTSHPHLLLWLRLVRDYLPLQQGLRPLGNADHRTVSVRVRDYLPLQQGLRHGLIGWAFFRLNGVRDYLPLQQGLRPTCLLSAPRCCHRQRLSSITTRIKTKNLSMGPLSAPRVRDYLPLQQGLRL